MMRNDAKNNVFRLCQAIAERRPLWVQGKGGNVSYKDSPENTLWIKATGLRLRDVVSDGELARLDISLLQKNLSELFLRVESSEDFNLEREQRYAEILSQALIAGSPRASMETGFHLFLNKRYVTHFHPASALLVAHEYKKNAPRVSKVLNQFFPNDWKMIARILPGLLLSRELSKEPSASCYILENHGVVLQDDTDPVGQLEKWDLFEKAFLSEFNYWLQGETRPIPLKVYFPDTAVFLSEIIKHLDTVSQQFVLKKEASADVQDIWASTASLYQAQPTLGVWDEIAVSRLSEMPVEKLRKLS